MKVRRRFGIFSLLLTMALPASARPSKSPPSAASPALPTAVLAGGCFWCIEAAFLDLPGVVAVVSGYAGGHVEHPSYEEVSSGTTGHREAVRVTFDPSKITYPEILKVLWHQIDPTDDGGQFADRGSQYRTAIFYENEEQRREAEASKAELARSGKFSRPVVTEILPFTNFYPAEGYHQKYCKLHPKAYLRYKEGSGRAGFIERVWGHSKPSKESLLKKLTPLQYQVTQEGATERPFHNEYWDNHREGLYVDVVSGEPLFSSTDKFDSGTGWPSFTRPVDPSHVVEREDRSFGMVRVEVESSDGRSHLGHLFPDGPKPTGLRYCINSAALRFIPKEDLEKEGYGPYLKLFQKH